MNDRHMRTATVARLSPLVRARTDRTRGVFWAAATAVISGFAVFANGFGVRAWGGVADATTYTTLKNALAALVLVGAAIVVGRRSSADGYRRPSQVSEWVGLAAVAILGGSVPFVLFFEGLATASSGQAAFIHKTLVVWVAILALIFLKERIGFGHVAAVALLLWGQAALLGGVGDLGLGSGELMMLAATLLWSVEVIVAKRLLNDVTPLMLGVARMAGGAVLLIAYGIVRGATVNWAAVGASHLLWIFATGLVLAAYVGTWYLALARAQAIDVTAVLVGGALITAMLNVGIRGLALPPVLGIGLVTAGVAVALATMWSDRRSVAIP